MDFNSWLQSVLHMHDMHAFVMSRRFIQNKTCLSCPNYMVLSRYLLCKVNWKPVVVTDRFTWLTVQFLDGTTNKLTKWCWLIKQSQIAVFWEKKYLKHRTIISEVQLCVCVFFFFNDLHGLQLVDLELNPFSKWLVPIYYPRLHGAVRA